MPVIPWPLVALIGRIADLFGYSTYVRATGGEGWHWGRIGAERVYFVRLAPGEAPAKRLKPRRQDRLIG
jgi:hypothetical protein